LDNQTYLKLNTYINVDRYLSDCNLIRNLTSDKYFRNDKSYYGTVHLDVLFSILEYAKEQALNTNHGTNMAYTAKEVIERTAFLSQPKSRENCLSPFSNEYDQKHALPIEVRWFWSRDEREREKALALINRKKEETLAKQQEEQELRSYLIENNLNPNEWFSYKRKGDRYPIDGTYFQLLKRLTRIMSMEDAVLELKYEYSKRWLKEENKRKTIRKVDNIKKSLEEYEE
jgi:hypothetical protein